MIIYIGNGSYLNGVPMRDMTEEEWDALPEELRAAALANGLYQDAGEKRVRGWDTGKESTKEEGKPETDGYNR